MNMVSRRAHAPANGAAPGSSAHRLQGIGPDAPQRDAVERFIRAVYASRYGARLRSFAPTLVALTDPHGQLVAAAGYRSAASGPLFLERYLDAPVQRLLRGTDGVDAPREAIVEVGHLVASRAGEGRRLIGLLGPVLADAGFDWVVSTLTQELRHLFLRMGVAPLALGVADPATLGPDAADWGSYYDHRPVVLAGHLPLAMAALGRREGAR